MKTPSHNTWKNAASTAERAKRSVTALGSVIAIVLWSAAHVPGSTDAPCAASASTSPAHHCPCCADLPPGQKCQCSCQTTDAGKQPEREKGKKPGTPTKPKPAIPCPCGAASASLAHMAALAPQSPQGVPSDVCLAQAQGDARPIEVRGCVLPYRSRAPPPHLTA